MELEGNKKKKKLADSSWLACLSKCFLITSSASPLSSTVENKEQLQEIHSNGFSPHHASKTPKRQPGGWKAMPFVLGNETFERLATIGMSANFMVFLLTKYHMDQVRASNLMNIWSGITNFAPLCGAFLSDAYVGRFFTIAVGSFASLVGMMTLTLVVWIPHFLPPPCAPQLGLYDHCKGPTPSQLGLLILALGFLSIGTGGIRPCSLPFGIDQFDATTEGGRRGINSFFNWYYTTFTLILIIAFTVVVYIQTSISWVWGFGIPTLLMVCSIILFFYGTKIYVYVKPEGSPFSAIAQVILAAYKKRKLRLPANDHTDDNGTFYNPPPVKGVVVTKLPLTNKFRFLNKAAIIQEGEVKSDGTLSNPWRLSSIQVVEELKCLIKIIPVWASGIICFTAMAQQITFTVSQALKMDRHLGLNFQIPAGSLIVISMITVGLWVPIYDRILVPLLRKVTKHEEGITLLQRIGIGILFSVMSMVAAGLIERMRRASAVAHGRPDGIAPISVMWLAPQLILMGFAEAFNLIGQLEFYYKEFPQNMSSVANSLYFVTSSGANYLSSIVITLVHKFTGRNGHPNWLTNDINAGKLDYFYYLLAGMGFLNMIYFLEVSRRYQYKGSTPRIYGDKPELDIELNDHTKQ